MNRPPGLKPIPYNQLMAGLKPRPSTLAYDKEGLRFDFCRLVPANYESPLIEERFLDCVSRRFAQNQERDTPLPSLLQGRQNDPLNSSLYRKSTSHRDSFWLQRLQKESEGSSTGTRVLQM